MKRLIAVSFIATLILGSFIVWTEGRYHYPIVYTSIGMGVAMSVYLLRYRWKHGTWLSAFVLALLLPGCTDVAPSMTGTTVFDANGFPTCVPTGFTCEVGVNAPAQPVRY